MMYLFLKVLESFLSDNLRLIFIMSLCLGLLCGVVYIINNLFDLDCLIGYFLYYLKELVIFFKDVYYLMIFFKGFFIKY